MKDTGELLSLTFPCDHCLFLYRRLIAMVDSFLCSYYRWLMVHHSTVTIVDCYVNIPMIITGSCI